MISTNFPGQQKAETIAGDANLNLEHNCCNEGVLVAASANGTKLANASWLHQGTAGYVMLTRQHQLHVQHDTRKSGDGIDIPVFT